MIKNDNFYKFYRRNRFYCYCGNTVTPIGILSMNWFVRVPTLNFYLSDAAWVWMILCIEKGVL